MAKITAESRELFNSRIVHYRETIKSLLDREKTILDLMQKEVSGTAYKKLLLAEEMLYITSIYLVMNNLSVEMLDTKNEESLNEGRKTLYKAIIYLEDIVSSAIDVPFSDYEAKVAEIVNTPLEKRYYLVRKLGLSIRLIMDAYGSNTKWKWTFVELQGRFATITKNIVDMTAASKNYFDPRSLEYELTVYYFRLLKKLLSQSADGYRERYELSTRRTDDIRLAINYLLAYRRILIILNERDEAEDVKKKALAWKDKMEDDIKNKRNNG